MIIIRKDLVSIQLLSKLEPHPDADRLLIATVQGWQAVVNKDAGLKEGELIAYFQNDAIMPARPEFEFLADHGYRVRPLKLRGVMSQGLILPLTAPFIVEKFGAGLVNLKEGEDVTERLGIQLYEKEIRAEDSLGAHPKYIAPENDEIGISPAHKHPESANAELRVQGYIKLLEELKGKDVYVTEKEDGTTSTYFLHPTTGEFIYSSKKNMLNPSFKNYWRDIAEKYHMKEKLEAYREKHGIIISVHGEICGPGIQKNPLGLKELDLFVFGIFDITHQKWFDYVDMLNATREMGLRNVRLIDTFVLNHTLKDLEKIILSHKYMGTDTIIEGIVVRPVKESEFPFSKALQARPSFKLLYADIAEEDGGPVRGKKQKRAVTEA